MSLCPYSCQFVKLFLEIIAHFVVICIAVLKSFKPCAVLFLIFLERWYMREHVLIRLVNLPKNRLHGFVQLSLIKLDQRTYEKSQQTNNFVIKVSKELVLPFIDDITEEF